ncbi:MAG: PDZ domain-containing protein [Chthoniobacterales bacterium]
MKKLFVGCVVLAVCAHGLPAGQKGWFGFGAAITGDGIFNPTVLSAKIDTVEPHSPAAEKGIAVGDEIVQVENTEVTGHKARELKPLMEKQVGETLHLRLKRSNGETYSVAIVAAQSPK